MRSMTTLTQDRCPACGAWLILVEVFYVATHRRRYPEIGNHVIYECQSCGRAYMTWAEKDDPLEEITVKERSLRAELATRRPFSVS